MSGLPPVLDTESVMQPVMQPVISLVSGEGALKKLDFGALRMTPGASSLSASGDVTGIGRSASSTDAALLLVLLMRFCK